MTDGLGLGEALQWGVGYIQNAPSVNSYGKLSFSFFAEPGSGFHVSSAPHVTRTGNFRYSFREIPADLRISCFERNMPSLTIAAPPF